nr:single-stranded DNA-binding protein [uncultured Porphyromonas sp.]
MEKIMLVGYLGADAKVVTINGEEKFIQASCAPVKNKKQQDTKSLRWYQLNFNLGLKKLLPYLKKGTLVAAVGALKVTAYADKEGAAMPAAVVYVDTIELLGGKDSASKNATPQESAQDQPQAQSQGQAQGDEDLPF